MIRRPFNSFEKPADSFKRSGVATQDLNFSQDSLGELLFEEINAGATPETYTTITPSGTETWTEITPTGTETYTEIEV